EMDNYYYYSDQLDIYGLLSVGGGLLSLGGGPIGILLGAPLAIIGYFSSYAYEYLRDEALEHCNDPNGASGDFTQHVPREYTEASIPREFENNLRYSKKLYELLQSVENLQTEREIQREIVNRMNKAEELGEISWQLFQLDDLLISKSLEFEHNRKILISLNKVNSLIIEDFANAGVTNQDILDAEVEIETNGISPELQELLNLPEDRLQEIEFEVGNITENGLFNLEDPQDNSYLDYYYENGLILEQFELVLSLTYDKIIHNVNLEQVELGIATGNIPIELSPENITTLESLNSTLNWEFDNKNWLSVLSISEDLITIVNTMMHEISNYSHPILLSYYNYATGRKIEALQNNQKHLVVSVPKFADMISIEPSTVNTIEIYLSLVNTTQPKTINLSIVDFDGIATILNSNKEEITQIQLNPGEVEKIYLNVSFSQGSGLKPIKLFFEDVDYNIPYYKEGLFDLIQDSDTTAPAISINYLGGNHTDESAGFWDVYAYDRESGIDLDSIEVYIDGVLVGTSFGCYAVPHSLGEHSIEVMVFNNDPTDSEQSTSIEYETIIDDDEIPPTIEYSYTGDGTDGQPGEIIVVASDDSELSVDPSGTYPVPNSLGTHNFVFTATDNDTDRVDDTLTTTIEITIDIIDDDSKSPEIMINYIGSGYDNDPGYFEWCVFDIDSGIIEVNITITYQSTEGLDDYILSFIGTDIGSWELTPNLGYYTIDILARDNDDDRTLAIDSLSTEVIRYQEIVDDDTSPPELSNLAIYPENFIINISFDAIDESGINDISIFINGELVDPISQDQTENTYTFLVENKWLFKKGLSYVEVVVTDGDNDRANDYLCSSISGTFENVLWDMYDYVYWQLEELKIYIDNNLNCPWNKCLIYKLTHAQERLMRAFEQVADGNITRGLCQIYIAKLFLRNVEIKTEMLARRNRISNEIATYIILNLHEIRNNIIIIMGLSTGSELAMEIGYLEVELLNLSDYVDQELPSCVGRCLSRKIWCASKLLEIAIFRISRDVEIDCLLKCVQWKLEWTLHKINWLLKKQNNSETQASFLEGEILEIIAKIELLKS
ncbi:MAG: hypothetical protein ACFE9Z_17705, partial [Promethearchaeota archaeon]